MSDGAAATVRFSSLEQAAMTPAQWAAIAITVGLSAVDGYDVLSVSFAAPALGHAWSLGKIALGVVLSSGLAGMAFGSLLFAPFADVIGRRPAVLIGLALMVVGAALSAQSSGINDLAAWRVVTGLGIGIMVGVITPLAAEFANAARRRLAVALMAVGYPAGGAIGGLVSSLVLKAFGWPMIFLVGAGVGGALFGLALFWLPESPDFLATREGPKALERLNNVLRRLGHPPVSSLVARNRVAARSYASLFSREEWPVTVRITVANLLFVLTVYYVLSWLPQMVGDAGFSSAQGSQVSAAANLAGVAGGLAVGALAHRAGLRGLTGAVMIGLGVATAVFGSTPAALPLLMLVGGGCGFLLFGGIAGLYAILATEFQPAARASGSGFVIGVGRLGSALGPYVAGWMFAVGLPRGEISIAFGLSACAGGLLLAFGHRLNPRKPST